MQDRLIPLLRQHSFKRAPAEGPLFVLASGKTSSYFVDVKQTAMRPEGVSVLSNILVDALWAWQWEAGEPKRLLQGVAGVALGGCPLATMVTLRGNMRGMHFDTLYVRKEPKDYGTAKLVEGPVQPGMRVALLEDVATTGGSSIKAIQALRAVDVVVDLVIAVVDREEGAEAAFRAEGVDFRSLVKVSEL